MLRNTRHDHDSNGESQRTTQKASDTPKVSERDEGKPIAEWVVFVLVIVAAICAVLGYTGVGITILAACSAVLGALRLMLRENSPWKVRSITFDSLICFCLAVGLVGTYFSILWLL
jgi:nitrate reductase NapE component